MPFLSIFHFSRWKQHKLSYRWYTRFKYSHYTLIGVSFRTSQVNEWEAIPWACYVWVDSVHISWLEKLNAKTAACMFMSVSHGCVDLLFLLRRKSSDTSGPTNIEQRQADIMHETDITQTDWWMKQKKKKKKRKEEFNIPSEEQSARMRNTMKPLSERKNRKWWRERMQILSRFHRRAFWYLSFPVIDVSRMINFSCSAV